MIRARFFRLRRGTVRLERFCRPGPGTDDDALAARVQLEHVLDHEGHQALLTGAGPYAKRERLAPVARRDDLFHAPERALARLDAEAFTVSEQVVGGPTAVFRVCVHG